MNFEMRFNNLNLVILIILLICFNGQKIFCQHKNSLDIAKILIEELDYKSKIEDYKQILGNPISEKIDTITPENPYVILEYSGLKLVFEEFSETNKELMYIIIDNNFDFKLTIDGQVINFSINPSEIELFCNEFSNSYTKDQLNIKTNCVELKEYGDEQKIECWSKPEFDNYNIIEEDEKGKYAPHGFICFEVKEGKIVRIHMNYDFYL